MNSQNVADFLSPRNMGADPTWSKHSKRRGKQHLGFPGTPFVAILLFPLSSSTECDVSCVRLDMIKFGSGLENDFLSSSDHQATRNPSDKETDPTDAIDPMPLESSNRIVRCIRPWLV